MARLHFEDGVIRNKSGERLGSVTYYQPWKRHVAKFMPFVIMAADCLSEVAGEVRRMDAARKEGNNA